MPAMGILYCGVCHVVTIPQICRLWALVSWVWTQTPALQWERPFFGNTVTGKHLVIRTTCVQKIMSILLVKLVKWLLSSKISAFGSKSLKRRNSLLQFIQFLGSYNHFLDNKMWPNRLFVVSEKMWLKRCQLMGNIWSNQL